MQQHPHYIEDKKKEWNLKYLYQKNKRNIPKHKIYRLEASALNEMTKQKCESS